MLGRGLVVLAGFYFRNIEKRENQAFYLQIA